MSCSWYVYDIISVAGELLKKNIPNHNFARHQCYWKLCRGLLEMYYEQEDVEFIFDETQPGIFWVSLSKDGVIIFADTAWRLEDQ